MNTDQEKNTLGTYEDIYRVVYAINFAGLVGGVLSYIIYSRSVFKKTSIGFYCKALAIFDQFTVFTMITGFATEIKQTSYGNTDDRVCKFLYYISLGISGVPGWIMVVFSIDQYLTIAWPNRFEFIRKRSFQFIVLIIIFLFHCFVYIDVLFTAGVSNVTFSNNRTILRCQKTPSALEIIFLFENILLPIAAIILTTFLVLRTIYKSRKRVGKEISSILSSLSLHSSISSESSKRRRDFKFAFNSVALNLTFMVFMTVNFLAYFITIDDFELSQLVQAIASLCFNINFASHFFIYLGVNSLFRQELLILLRIRKA